MRLKTGLFVSCRVTVSYYRDPGPRGSVRWWGVGGGAAGGGPRLTPDPWRTKAEHTKIEAEKAAFVTPQAAVTISAFSV